jgi:hypothetical protein
MLIAGQLHAGPGHHIVGFMGVTALFLPQDRIDIWERSGAVDFDGESLGIRGEAASVELVPAVRFIKELSGSEDPNDLVGVVKTIDEITDLGADHYRDSVLIGETAYEVVEGYIARPMRVITEVAKTSYGNEQKPQQWKTTGANADTKKASAPPAPASAPAVASEPAAAPPEPTSVEDKKAAEKRSDAEELARLLLEKL